MPLWSESGYEPRWIEGCHGRACPKCEECRAHCECPRCVVCGELATTKRDNEPVCKTCDDAMAAEEAPKP